MPNMVQTVQYCNFPFAVLDLFQKYKNISKFVETSLFQGLLIKTCQNVEEVAQRCSVKKEFLEILQVKTCARVSF